MKQPRPRNLPKRPSLVGTQDEVADEIWAWFIRLQDSCISADADSERKHLQRVEVEIDALIVQSRKNLDSKVNTYNPDDDDLKAGWLAGFFSLLGHCRRRQNKFDLAVEAYQRAIELAPWNMHHVEACLDTLIALGHFDRAVLCMNNVPLKYLKTEDDSTARLILKWACDNPAFASGVQARVLKKCIELISIYGGLRSAEANQGDEKGTNGATHPLNST